MVKIRDEMVPKSIFRSLISHFQPPVLKPEYGFSEEFCDFIKACLQKDVQKYSDYNSPTTNCYLFKMQERPKFKDLLVSPSNIQNTKVFSRKSPS